MTKIQKATGSNGDYVDVPMRVRYAETDQMGVAYYANYLVWFEVARAELCRVRGFSYAEMERKTESFLVVAESFCRYHRPLPYDAPFVVRTWIRELRKRTITFEYQVLADGSDAPLAEGYTVHVVTDARGRPKSFPVDYRQFLEG